MVFGAYTIVWYGPLRLRKGGKGAGGSTKRRTVSWTNGTWRRRIRAGQATQRQQRAPSDADLLGGGASRTDVAIEESEYGVADRVAMFQLDYCNSDAGELKP